MSKNIEQKCLTKGVKLTDQRKIIAKVMSESNDHPDVDELYNRVSKIDPKISIATVYRTVSSSTYCLFCWTGFYIKRFQECFNHIYILISSRTVAPYNFYFFDTKMVLNYLSLIVKSIKVTSCGDILVFTIKCQIFQWWHHLAFLSAMSLHSHF